MYRSRNVVSWRNQATNMSARHLKKILDVTKHVPLWKRPIPDYPLYWKGNPQLRVFLPMFWMKMISPKTKVPPNHVIFEVHPQMTKYDIKNYLEKIYDVQVLTVRTTVVQGEARKHPASEKKLSPEPDKRLAFVSLDNATFEFPNIVEKKLMEEEKQKEEVMKMKSEQENKDNDLPEWFMN